MLMGARDPTLGSFIIVGAQFLRPNFVSHDFSRCTQRTLTLPMGISKLRGLRSMHLLRDSVVY
jgi:hypothetical protein